MLNRMHIGSIGALGALMALNAAGCTVVRDDEPVLIVDERPKPRAPAPEPHTGPESRQVRRARERAEAKRRR